MKRERCQPESYLLFACLLRMLGQWRSQYQLRLNTPIQGSARDGFKNAAALLWKRRDDRLGSPKVDNTVHDEMVVEIDAEHVDVGEAWLHECIFDGMREVLGSEAPVSVEITVADNGGEKR